MRWIKLILILLVCFTALHAMQTGIKVGYNVSGIIPVQEEYTNMPGFRIGGISQLPVNPFHFQCEFLLSSKGFMSKSVGDTRLTNLFLYLQLPLSLKYELPLSDSWNLYALGGCYASLKIIAINLVSEIDGVRGLDAGLHLGGGIRFRKIDIEARYEQSILNFDLIEPQKFHCSFSAGMNFYFKEK